MADDVEQEGTSRRTVLKRAGVASAVIWTAPVLSSLNSPAFAGESPRPCAEWHCGEDITPFACGDDCYNTGTTEGDCFCWQDFGCTGVLCTSSTECPPGYRCEPNGCCGGECAPPCASGTVIVAGAKTNSGA